MSTNLFLNCVKKGSPYFLFLQCDILPTIFMEFPDHQAIKKPYIALQENNTPGITIPKDIALPVPNGPLIFQKLFSKSAQECVVITHLFMSNAVWRKFKIDQSIQSFLPLFHQV